MAQVSFKSVPPELEEHYKKALQSGDRFSLSVIKTKRLFTSRTYKKGLSQKSLIPVIAPVWASFDSVTKTNWSNAGLYEGLTGWKEFLKDTAIRRANGLTGYSTPQTDRQCNVGRMTVASPATGFTIQQSHPNTYYVMKKVRGTKSQYNPQIVAEYLSLPLSIGISYRADLVSAGGTPHARFFVEVYSNYQGLEITTPLEIDFNLDGNWHVEFVTLTGVIGVVRGYTAFIQILNARGNLYFDNVNINHSSETWARDPHCNDINQTFTKAFYQVPKHWDTDSLPTGCFFDSFFYGMM
jgi:hypothetical protein